MSQVDPGPNLLLNLHGSVEPRGVFRAGIASILFHAGLLVFLTFLATLDTPLDREGPVITADLRRAIPLVVPLQLTQKAPNRGKIAKEVDVEDLLPRPATKQHLPTPPQVKQFHPPPSPQSPAPPQPAAPRIPEPPKIEASAQPPAPPPTAGTPNVPPPPAPPVEKPKLALETPGQQGTVQASPTAPRLAPPKISVAEAIHQVARGAGGGAGVIVGDVDQLDSPQSLQAPAVPTRPRSSVELLSDPMGVDFRPYLIRVLAAVRQNWLAVIPESARMGRRGLVVLQFIVDRNGQVPKLVISMPSGSEPLDRAAVAGISASVPLPRCRPSSRATRCGCSFRSSTIRGERLSVNFSGVWKANLRKSKLLGPVPRSMTIRIEHSDSQLVEEITLTKPNGTEDRLVFQCVINGQKTTNLLNGMEVSGCSRWEGDELIIESWIKSGQRERYFCDCWSLSADGRNLTMEHRNDDLAGQIVVLERTAEPRLDFFSAIDHVQLAMPEGQEGKAREFFIGVLGMRELTKPANLAARGGCWFESGGVQIHLGVERDFRPALKAHPALRCRNYDDLLRRLAGHGVARQDDDNIPGARRCHIADPFGNRIELIAE